LKKHLIIVDGIVRLSGTTLIDNAREKVTKLFDYLDQYNQGIKNLQAEDKRRTFKLIDGEKK